MWLAFIEVQIAPAANLFHPFLKVPGRFDRDQFIFCPEEKDGRGDTLPDIMQGREIFISAADPFMAISCRTIINYRIKQYN